MISPANEHHRRTLLVLLGAVIFSYPAAVLALSSRVARPATSSCSRSPEASSSLMRLSRGTR